MSDAKQGGDWPILRLPVDRGEALTVRSPSGVSPQASDPREPGTTVVALGDGINECKGAGVCDAKADRVLCMPKGGSSR